MSEPFLDCEFVEYKEDQLARLREQIKNYQKVEVLEIPTQDGIDAITVYWHNYEPGKGMVTITC